MEVIELENPMAADAPPPPYEEAWEKSYSADLQPTAPVQSKWPSPYLPPSLLEKYPSSTDLPDYLRPGPGYVRQSNMQPTVAQPTGPGFYPGQTPNM